MQAPHTPANDAHRLASLRAIAIRYMPPEERFDYISSVAQRLFGMPIAVTSRVYATQVNAATEFILYCR